MNMDILDKKLNEVFPGKVVRKDLLLQVKKGTNVPSFVLEFLLARYCASDDPREIQEGLAAVLETIQKNYVRPDESNRAQMLVQQKGKHTFIDRIHVRYYEKKSDLGREWKILTRHVLQSMSGTTKARMTGYLKVAFGQNALSPIMTSKTMITHFTLRS